MKEKIVLIIGSGHLAYRVKKLLNTLTYNVEHITIEEINSSRETGSLFQNFNDYIKETDLTSVVMTYLLDDKDDYNLQLIIALISLDPNIAITASLFNEILHLIYRLCRSSATSNKRALKICTLSHHLHQPLQYKLFPIIVK